MPISSDFAKRLTRNKSAKTRFKKAKEARPGEFTAPEIPNGNYVARCSVSAGNTKKDGTPFVSIKWVIVEGEHAKKSWSQDFYLEGDDEDRVQKTWDALSKAIQVLAGIDDEVMEEFESWEMEDLIEVLEEIDKEAPYCRIGIRNWKGEKSSGITAYFNALVDPDEIGKEDEDEDEEEPVVQKGRKGKSAPKQEAVDDEGDEEDDEEEVAEEPEAEEEEDEEEEEAEELVEIKKGMVVYYKPPKSKSAVECEVKRVSKVKKTCLLARTDDEDETFKDIPWDSIEVVEDEE